MIIKTKRRESIIIVGCGDIGARIAMMLAKQGKDVKVIDFCSSSFKRIESNLTVEQVTGDGTDIAILRQCGIENAAVFLAATDKDRTNIMIAEIVKEVFKVPKVIAKIYDFENNTQFMEHSNVQPFYPYLLAMKELEKYFESK